MKVFVSSTFQDLQEHRKRVIDAIDRLRTNGADIEWLGMEAFGARDDLPSDACVKFVDECELYIGFFGVRYGSIDPKSKTSMTEVEYRRAVEKNLPRLIFLISDDASVKPKDIEASPEGQAKLKALKDDLKKDRVADFFTTPEDLAYKVATALQQKLQVASPKSAVPSVIPFPPIPYFAHVYPLQEHFTGRKPEREQLSDWLTRGERQTQAIFLVEAMGGMGKSALAWYWLQNDLLPLKTEYWALAGVFWWSFYDERDFGVFLSRAIEYASGGKIDPKQISSDRERVDVLANLLRQSRFLFVLDGFERVLRAYARMDAAHRGDEVNEDERNNYRACTDPNIGIFLKMLASGGTLTKTLITSRLFPRELDGLDGVRALQLTGMDAADAVEFFHKQGIKGTHVEIETACAAYGFHPLTLRLLAGALKQDPRYHADITNAPRVEMREADKEKRMQRMLEFAYNSLPPQEQKLLSQLSAFRSPMKWETLAKIFAIEDTGDTEEEKENSVLSVPSVADFANEDELMHAVVDLQERGLYMRDSATDTFDLHPVIRRYCYDRLSDRAATHARFIVYFARMEAPKKIQSLADLQPIIELYHHTVRAGQCDEAVLLFHDRLNQATYYQLGAYQLRIELLCALFPDGEDKLPPLDTDDKKAWTLNELANSYALAGQPRRAVPLLERVNNIYENVMKNRQYLAIGLGNVANRHTELGELAAAERNLRRSIEICREIKGKFNEANEHHELARVLAYRGIFDEAQSESEQAENLLGKENIQQLGTIWAHRALRALLMGDTSTALSAAHKAREFAEETARTSYPLRADFIRSEWMIGAALVASVAGRGRSIRKLRLLGKVLGSESSDSRSEGALANTSPLHQAEQHLQEALSRDRKIGLVEVEAAILLEFARLRFAQADQRQKMADDRQVQLMRESFDFANEAQEIAERCEYRLQEAEIHNFLADWHFETVKQGRKGAEEQGRKESLNKAREHGERAKERAWCDGPPYYYKVAYEKAERLLKEIGKETC